MSWLRSKDEILEYPYTGVIKRVTEGTGLSEDSEEVIYTGMMDEHMTTQEEGSKMQTSSYIISIPITMGTDGKYVIPRKGDLIEIDVLGGVFELVVDNAEPSQLGGVSIYATRKDW